MVYGLTLTGFNKKDFVTCFADIEINLKARFGNELKTTGDSVAGNIMGCFAETVAIHWEQEQAVYLSRWIQSAENESLDNAVALIAISRIPARYSTVPTATLTNNSNSPLTIPANSLVKQSSTGIQWQTVNQVIIPANDSLTVALRSVETGNFTAEIGSIDTIISLINGWSSVTNNSVALVGRIRETDTELRIRAANEIVTSKGGIGSAIANRLKTEIAGVTFIAWEENRSHEHVNGLLPHSLHFVVVGGDDTEIANLIAEAKPVGIATNGQISINVLDDFGNNKVIKYDRAYQQNIYLIVNITKNNDFPSNGLELVKKCLLDYVKTLKNGEKVRNHYLSGALNPVPGIDDLVIFQDISPNPVSSGNITITNDKVANLISSNIVVNIS